MSLLCHFSHLVRAETDQFAALDPEVLAGAVDVGSFTLNADVVLIS